MKILTKLPMVLAITAVVWATGCQNYRSSRQASWNGPVGGTGITEPPVAQAQPAAPAPSTPAIRTCADPTDGPVQLAKQMPKEAFLGQTFEYQLTLTARDCIGNVAVADRIPSGASYVKSDPAAQIEGDNLVWRISAMDPGQSATLRVWLKAEKEGVLGSCATVTADPRVCASTTVGKPSLTIDKTGPQTAVLGSTVDYAILVANNGSALTRGVAVTDHVPDGLESADGRKRIVFEVGDLAPGQSKTLTVPLKATKRGEFCNVAVATSSNAASVTNDACTTVLQPGLKIVKQGDEERFLGRNATYKIQVSNTGDTTLTNVVVTDTAPAPTAIVSASGATINGNQAVWRLPRLAAGQNSVFEVVLTSKTAGSHCNAAAVTAEGGLKDATEFCTLWKGVSALLLEKADDPDPIQVDEITTYTVRVTNQGTADDTNVKMVVEFPEELTPVSADHGGVISGKQVTFPPYPRLAPKQAFEYHVKAKGTKAGDARIRFIRTSDKIPAPTTAEESTRVY
ncbi:MAG TPA: hypothetical protein P5186_17060 [Candidatus Paceibacterota bacterium]|nr:hypothetical protein [Verrucomicrobiota bacterium]HRY49762.1 hypothetical protein [Candidatus Paceibacterota bacterium]HRZ99737.1 hypothetical protein [Candidatus Paceibacterota bacterium]